MNFTLEDVKYLANSITQANAGNLAAAQSWIWDEAEQYASMHSHLPLTAEYVDAVMQGRSTKGIPMSVMQQMGRICVADLRSGVDLLDEIFVCGIVALESTNTNCMVQCMGQYRKWHSGTDSEFTRTVRFITHALLADGAASNGCLKRYEIARTTPPKSWPLSFGAGDMGAMPLRTLVYRRAD
jgi:hypothetical protein